YQRAPAITTDATGGFVVGWESQTQPGDGIDRAAVVRSFDASGNGRTGEIVANTTFLGPQFEPTVATRPDASFFVAWTDGFLNAENVRARSFAAAGSGHFVLEQPVNLDPPYGDQAASSADADAAGNIVLVWESQNDVLNPHWTIFARRYNAVGAPISAALQVSQTTSGEQRRPVVALDPQ